MSKGNDSWLTEIIDDFKSRMKEDRDFFVKTIVGANALLLIIGLLFISSWNDDSIIELESKHMDRTVKKAVDFPYNGKTLLLIDVIETECESANHADGPHDYLAAIVRNGTNKVYAFGCWDDGDLMDQSPITDIEMMVPNSKGLILVQDQALESTEYLKRQAGVY